MVLVALVPCGAAAQEAGRKCGPAPLPETLPALDRVLDSALAIRALTFPAANPLYMTAVLTLHFQRDGTMRRLVVLEHDAGADTATVLARVVAPLVRVQDSVDAPWGARVRVHLAERPTLSLERSRFCPPVIEPRPQSDRYILAAPTVNRVPFVFRATLRILVTEDGAVEATDLQGDVVDAALRDFILDDARRNRYKPALLDGFPVAAWIEQRLSGDRSHRP
jgi:hypothetical protein